MITGKKREYVEAAPAISPKGSIYIRTLKSKKYRLYHAELHFSMLGMRMYRPKVKTEKPSDLSPALDCVLLEYRLYMKGVLSPALGCDLPLIADCV